MTYELISYILGGLTIGSALMVILSSHPIRSVMYLVITFFFISGHMVLMNAQFLAIVNIIVYAGAIMVLFLFVLMLLNLNKESEPRMTFTSQMAAILAGGTFLLVLLAALAESTLPPMPEGMSKQIADIQNEGLVQNLGQLLFSKYIPPFEVSSILFIAAMVGAVLLAKREKQNTEEI
ncbi:MAG: NADH-quinone oxidoreductase subunit J [Bacteroidetes bacterium]|nr:NADH-quinone oxidoreductase subunit J [Bacteroidota bacterium]